MIFFCNKTEIYIILTEEKIYNKIDLQKKRFLQIYNDWVSKKYIIILDGVKIQ